MLYGLISFGISPEWVQTDNGDPGAKIIRMAAAVVTLEQNVRNGTMRPQWEEQCPCH